MIKRLITTALVVMTGFTGTQAHAWDRPKVEFTAQQTMNAMGMQMSGKIYSSPIAERREMNQGGMSVVSIMRYDKNVAWTLMPQQHMYMEMSLAGMKDEADLSNYKVDKTKLGEETINGIKTEKSKMVMTKADGTRMEGLMWATKEGIVVKMDAESKGGKHPGKFGLELRDLSIGMQNPALFAIPAGYQKLDMSGMPGMGGMGGGMGGGMNADMLKGMMGQ